MLLLGRAYHGCNLAQPAVCTMQRIEDFVTDEALSFCNEAGALTVVVVVVVVMVVDEA